eukprot:1497496-Pyramimonas_sp.AAC.1
MAAGRTGLRASLSNNTTSFYGSSCATDGKGALNSELAKAYTNILGGCAHPRRHPHRSTCKVYRVKQTKSYCRRPS